MGRWQHREQPKKTQFNSQYRKDLQRMGIKGRDLARMRLKNERNPQVISIVVQVVSACGILLIVFIMGAIK